ncbi:hypothetical protein J6590_087796 [Homalodisca vitripennis]|nr:hypothetical protein J6590_087796 [Homalodisca vitripennis]
MSKYNKSQDLTEGSVPSASPYSDRGSRRMLWGPSPLGAQAVPPHLYRGGWRYITGPGRIYFQGPAKTVNSSNCQSVCPL